MNKPLPMGIIGMGYAGMQHYKSAREVAGLTIVAAAEPSNRVLPKEIKHYTDWREMIARENLDAISICAPHYLHAEILTGCLDAGKHVIIEKPMAVNAGQHERLANYAEQSGKVVMIEMTHRFYPPVQEAKALVASGEIGQVFAVRENIIESLEGAMLPAWMLDRSKAGGGVALTSGTHMLDRISWVCGQPLTLKYVRTGYEFGFGDIEDTAIMQLELHTGAPVVLNAIWARRFGDTDEELTIYATKATLRVQAWKKLKVEWCTGEVQQSACYEAGIDHLAKVRVGITSALREFVAAIDEGRAAVPGPYDLLPTQRLVDQFYKMAGTEH